MNFSLFQTLENVHLLDANLDEPDSFYFLQEYYQENYSYYRYSSPDIYTFDEVTKMSNNFCMFFAKVKDRSGNTLSTPISIKVFRFMLHEDGSFSAYYTPKRKRGYVVEGMFWSNGMCYQVREDKKENFELYQRVLFVDSVTKTLHQYP